MKYQLYKNIISDPDVCNGKPVLDGTRVTVQSVMEMVLAGESTDEILLSFPRITIDDIDTCKLFTSQLIERPVTIKPLKAAG